MLWLLFILLYATLAIVWFMIRAFLILFALTLAALALLVGRSVAHANRRAELNRNPWRAGGPRSASQVAYREWNAR
jgi:hypothetical protein